MYLDRYQGRTKEDRQFGYIVGDDGGWFFTHMPSIEETIDSLEVDQVDGDGGITIDDAREFLRERLASDPPGVF